MDTENLWGEIPEVEPIKTPINILKEQASLLGEKTNGLLEGEANLHAQNVDKMVASMRIVAPVLGNYSVNLLQITYGLEFYPVTVINLIVNEKIEASDESVFKGVLKSIFTHEAVRKIISTLLRQVKSLE